MSAPGRPPLAHPGGDAAGTAAIRPSEAHRFAGRIDALEQGVTEAHEALRRLAETPLATGTGQDNAAISAWYRELLTADTAPAARALATDLETVRRAVRASAEGWERTEAGAAGSFRPDAGDA